MNIKYSLNIVWSEEDECFVVTVPEFPNLSAFGRTIQEAIKDAYVVLKMALDSLERDGINPPDAQTHTPEQEFSGQVRLRMPRTLHGELVKCAGKEGVSLNTHMVSLLSKQNTATLLNLEIKTKIENLVQQQDVHFATIHRRLNEHRPHSDTSEISMWAVPGLESNSLTFTQKNI